MKQLCFVIIFDSHATAMHTIITKAMSGPFQLDTIQ